MDIEKIKKILKDKFGSEFIGLITCNEKKYIYGVDILQNLGTYYEFRENTIEKIQNEELLTYITNIYETKDKNILY